MDTAHRVAVSDEVSARTGDGGGVACRSPVAWILREPNVLPPCC